ncbi:conserved protein of unknown function [Paenibacillus alvei]|uniref:Uncharacterized protein n=1 Tax=Paenibacillus alvei TaxID=44250 RepID=A0A383RAI5_PAEAL|nr:conserved protein of unknown function [Paenibacillus alvei]
MYIFVVPPPVAGLGGTVPHITFGLLIIKEPIASAVPGVQAGENLEARLIPREFPVNVIAPLVIVLKRNINGIVYTSLQHT